MKQILLLGLGLLLFEKISIIIIIIIIIIIVIIITIKQTPVRQTNRVGHDTLMRRTKLHLFLKVLNQS